MTSKDFCYWLQGYFEITTHAKKNLTAEQVKMIQKHLNLVFKHEIDPSYGDQTHQDALSHIHSSGSSNVLVRC